MDSWRCKDNAWVGAGLVAFLLCALISIPIWRKIVNKFGRTNSWLAFNLVNALTNILYVFCGR